MLLFPGSSWEYQTFTVTFVTVRLSGIFEQLGVPSNSGNNVTLGKELGTVPTIKELEQQVNASRKLIRKFLVDECGAVMEQGKPFVATAEQASLVANRFGARDGRTPLSNKDRFTVACRPSVSEEVLVLREEKARLEERVKGLDAQVLLYQNQVSDLREQLRLASDALRVANESLQSTSRALEEAHGYKSVFSRLFGGRRQLKEKND